MIDKKRNIEIKEYFHRMQNVGLVSDLKLVFFVYACHLLLLHVIFK